MPERIEELRSHLRALEAEVDAGHELDEATKASLAQVAEEIREILDRNQPQEAAPVTLVDRLQQEERSFEASHPQLTQVLARIINALGQMGI